MLGADLVEKRLFDVALIDVKAKRVVSPPCPSCGRRGYCVRVCERYGVTPAFDFLLRWAYVARVEFSNPTVRELALFVRVREVRMA